MFKEMWKLLNIFTRSVRNSHQEHKVAKKSHTHTKEFLQLSFQANNAVLHVPSHQVKAEPALPRQFLQSDPRSCAYSTAVQMGKKSC